LIIDFAGAAALPKVQGALSLAGVDCRNLNTNSYAVVEVDASSGIATVTVKDQNGLLVLNQLPPFAACTKAFGQ
jgi:hypothetical protein